MAQLQPKWTPEAATLAKETAEEFEENIRRLSVRLARHESHLYVDPRHVNEAVDCLKKSGLNRVVWYRRPELIFGFGTGLFCLSFSFPDGVGALKEYVAFPVYTAVVLMIIGMVTGSILMVMGWLRAF